MLDFYFRLESSPRQLVCVEMLKECNYKSFEELITLLRLDRDQRKNARPFSTMLKDPPLEEQREKLETMAFYLSRAEKAEREGLWKLSCEERLHLGHYFFSQKDLWLSFYFYQSCANKERGGRSKLATEARLRMAEIYLQQGDLEESRLQAEKSLEQAEEGGWLDSDGRPMKLWASTHLGRIYCLLADASLAAANYNTAKRLLDRGFKVVTEVKDKLAEAEVLLRQGLLLQRLGDHPAARQVFSRCMKNFNMMQDLEGQVKTYKATAKSLESEGNIEETLEILEKAADICRSNGLQGELADVCLTQGTLYSKMDQLTKGVEFFQQGYKAALNTGDKPLVQKAKVCEIENQHLG
ncbi:tetratricopeptide repeat protein 29 [Cyprinodon tularosa]|uniref:tetratricopeptide repeat protein 29 n=1 Tax=Cyprinodon tularosa TaxID=77115 RepID=UPI0018E25EED|nr:tetratricopeptide repeat protein 29 [Cyprinodon tularosa]